VKTVLVLSAGMLLALAACAERSAWISPNDPAYQRSGAPRSGEQPLQYGNLYGRIQGPGDHDSP
jgi:hypothetical protein